MINCNKHPNAKRAKDGRCSKCESIRRMEYRARNIDRALAYRAAYKDRELELSRTRHAADPQPGRAKVKKWRDAHPDRVKEMNASQYAANPEKAKERVDAWRKENPDKVRAKQATWRQANKDKIKEQNKKQYAKSDKAKRLVKGQEWRDANRDKVRAAVRKWGDKHPECEANRRASKLNATPVWANQFFISEIYDLARRRTKLTKFPWHVDHIVPLKSPLVCGLHCEQNLRVVPGADNSRKGNREWPDRFQSVSA